MQTRISRVTRVFYGNVRAPDGISVIEVMRSDIIIIWKVARYLEIGEHISFSSIYELIFCKLMIIFINLR